MCPLLALPHPRLFSIFLLRTFTLLMTQTRQAVCAIKQSIYLDVYGLALQLCLLLWSGDILVLFATPR
jgi:hypothetical protein